MRAKLVTAYVPIPNHPRTPAEYGALGERLGNVPVFKKAFYSTLDFMWLLQFVKNESDVRHAEGDNPAKNTMAYHAVQHEKLSFLKQAAAEDADSDVFVWVDYGIFSQPGHSNQAIWEFMNKVDDKHIYIPGCWGYNAEIPFDQPCWRFCGSVISVPRQYLNVFEAVFKATVMQHITKTKLVDWEVNNLARVEQRSALRRSKLPIKWYQADHNVSMFTNLPVKDDIHEIS